MNSNTRVLLVSVAALLLISIPYMHTSAAREGDRIAHSAHTFKELSDGFQNLARQRGAVFAYSALREAQFTSTVDFHLLGHAIGEILFEQKGVAGIADCTDDFRNACSHSIVIRAFQQDGEKALDEIRAVCKKAPGGSGAYAMCYHGLGHGIFAYYGYDMTTTIKTCLMTGTKEAGNKEAFECISGMVMELMGGGGHEHELWEKAQKKYLHAPLDPCLSSMFPHEYRSACFSYLTPRLFELAGMDLQSPDPFFFAKSFSFCLLVPQSDTESRRSCFGSFGKEFISFVLHGDIRQVNDISEGAARQIESWCMEAKDDEGIRACIEGAAGVILWGGENKLTTSQRFCNALTTYGTTCAHGLGVDAGDYLTPERKKTLCSGLLPALSAECTTAHRL